MLDLILYKYYMSNIIIYGYVKGYDAVSDSQRSLVDSIHQILTHYV